MKLENNRRLRNNTHFLRRIFIENPVLAYGLALPFVIVVTTDLRTGVILSGVMAITCIPCMLISSLVKERIPLWLRPVVYSFIALTIITAARLLLRNVAPGILDPLGIYLSLMAINGLLLVGCENYACREKWSVALLRGVSYTLGFAFVVCVISAVREVFGRGTFWGEPVPFTFQMPGILIPFAGFILTGFLAAIINYIHRAVAGGVFVYANREPLPGESTNREEVEHDR